MLDSETVAANMAAQRRIFESILDFSRASANRAVIADNAEWIAGLSYIEALRDIGKFFSVNQMIQRDSVRERLTREQGISYTEFSYMLLQAWDFKHLFEKSGVTIQLGGSDQWGNIVSGVELVRRTCQAQAHGVTCPLVTRADGGKFGKTEAGPIWLSADRTSPYALYQFFLNTADADVGRFLRMFTFLGLDEIEELERIASGDPSARTAHRVLAREVTTLVHGAQAAAEAEAATQALFTGQIAGLPLHLIREAMAGVPTSRHVRATFRDDGLPVVDILCMTEACSSRRQAREMLAAGAITLNGRKVGPADRITRDQLLHGQLAAIRRGKKNWFMGIWE
jgi:tyrosyl-tRNA synthetase